MTNERWRTAQRYEKEYWEKLGERIAARASSQFTWYQWRADQLIDRLRHLQLDQLVDGQARVIEIGSGPVGLVAYFPAVERVAVDPLENFYAGNKALAALRNPSVEYRQGAGEQLPCESGRYDLAIIENCIDHVHDVTAVMGELARVLKPQGVLYLTVNCRTRWGYLVHRLLSSLRIDAGHPHTFTPTRAKNMLQNGVFRLLSCEVASYFEALRGDLQCRSTRARIKALVGVSEFLVTAVARRSQD